MYLKSYIQTSLNRHNLRCTCCASTTPPTYTPSSQALGTSASRIGTGRAGSVLAVSLSSMDLFFPHSIHKTSALDPPQEHPPLELILIPGVAFDPTLSRIGHGKGYYDRFISLASAHALRHDRPRPTLVALALREQVLKPGEVPMSEHDWKVDAIITPEGIVAGDAGEGEESVVEAHEGAKGGRIGLSERSDTD